MFCEPVRVPMYLQLRGKTQCLLGFGNWRTVSWVPDKQAVVGQSVRLTKDPNTWTIPEAYRTAS